MVSCLGYAYPWDVVGDPDFAGRVTEAGLDHVVLAASYHSARAATPYHPRHQLVDARHAALYRPVRPEAWAGRRLTPLPPDWVEGPDSFGSAASSLRAAGLTVSAWVVLTHNTRLGQAFPDVAVRNCFGDVYPYALCPAQPEVREYAATLAAEAVRDVELAGISLEACGQLGLNHLSHHEKTAGVWSAAAERLLSVCCCGICTGGWRDRGLDPEYVLASLRAAVLDLRDGRPAQLADDMAEVVLAARQANTDALRHEVLAGLDAPVTLHGHPDPWATGASPGLTPAAIDEVPGVLLPCWPTTASTADLVTATRKLGATRIGAYVTVMPPADPAELDAHRDRLVAAGADELHLYHLGLAGAPGQAALQNMSFIGRKR
jgi:hypothetical protein